MASPRVSDPLMAVVSALPQDMWAATVPALLERAVAENPAYFLEPVRPEAIAQLLQTTTGALAQQRFRGEGPPWSRIGSSVYYESRLSALQWARREMGLDASPPAGRRAA